MLLYLLDFRKVSFEGASKSSRAFFTVYDTCTLKKQEFKKFLNSKKVTICVHVLGY